GIGQVPDGDRVGQRYPDFGHESRGTPGPALGTLTLDIPGCLIACEAIERRSVIAPLPRSIRSAEHRPVNCRSGIMRCQRRLPGPRAITNTGRDCLLPTPANRIARVGIERHALSIGKDDLRRARAARMLAVTRELHR